MSTLLKSHVSSAVHADDFTYLAHRIRLARVQLLRTYTELLSPRSRALSDPVVTPYTFIYPRIVGALRSNIQASTRNSASTNALESRPRGCGTNIALFSQRMGLLRETSIVGYWLWSEFDDSPSLGVWSLRAFSASFVLSISAMVVLFATRRFFPPQKVPAPHI